LKFLRLIKKLVDSRELSIINYQLSTLFSCSPYHKISRAAKNTLLRDSATSNAFIGISIYDPETKTYLYNHNATKNFIPASNTKLFSLYAGMKYLGDSLPGLRYVIQNDSLYVLPTGDPSFLNSEFSYQPAIDLINKKRLPTIFSSENWRDEKFGYGWAWDDYTEDYMAERNSLPLNANIVNVIFSKNLDHNIASTNPNFLNRGFVWNMNYHWEPNRKSPVIKRKLDENTFDIYYGKGEQYAKLTTPYVTNGISSSLQILNSIYPWINKQEGILHSPFSVLHLLRSIPSDSLFRPMMHRSDNFFAEQTLLMVSNERLGYMKDADIIDTLLNVDLKDIPQKPNWVDGSGLSRYNLFSPQSFIYILNKLSDEFGRQRMFNILPTGGQGTLRSYYLKDSGSIYAKTGTVSNNCALSGYLRTNSGKWLIFSILANHYQTGATPIRKASERFLEQLRKIY
jgi:D-alanyl-D-alanine carboxypeptidase/D-alanyl-D-alanine-endopeptidase (penicillin-binding protein 4)